MLYTRHVYGDGERVLKIVQMLLRYDADIKRKANLKGRLMTALEKAQKTTY